MTNPADPSPQLDRAIVLVTHYDQQARHRDMYGEVVIRITYKGGVATAVRHHIEGIELAGEIEAPPTRPEIELIQEDRKASK